MSKDEIIIESLPLDEQGRPILKHLPGEKGKITILDKDGTREIDGVRVKTELETKIIKLGSSNIGRVIDICEGSKFRISLGDAVNGQVCPGTMALGEVVLVKGKLYELEYTDIPVVGWVKRDISQKDPNAKVQCYPDHIRTQKQLIDLILSHENIYTCPFAKWNIEYPPHIQDKLDMESLERREQALKEKKLAVEAQFLKEEKELKKRKDMKVKEIAERAKVEESSKKGDEE